MAQMPNVISGTVRDPGGNPVAEARVYFTGGPVPLPDIAALTNGNGAFSLSAPSTGTYHLGCAAEGFAPGAATVTVTAGQDVRLEIWLKP
jgi:carboxypeptidase family protein